MILVIGASSGLANVVVNSLSQFDDVILTHYRNPLGNNSQFLDLTDNESIDNFISINKTRLKNLTLVNFSAYSKDGILYHYGMEDWERSFKINVRGPFYLIQKILPIMISQKYGRIINVSSILANKGAVGAGAYSSSKSALIGLTRTLSKEYARFNILSNILELGYFEGGLTDRMEVDKLNEIISNIPTLALGDPDEIAKTIKLLVESNYINGSQIKINGGMQ